MECSRRWRIFDSNVLIESLGEDEFAVFNGSYWDSSVLNAIDACLLRAVGQSVTDFVSEEMLVRHVAAELELPIDGPLRQYAEQSLHQMAQVGLIYRERLLEDR